MLTDTLLFWLRVSPVCWTGSSVSLVSGSEDRGSGVEKEEVGRLTSG